MPSENHRRVNNLHVEDNARVFARGSLNPESAHSNASGAGLEGGLTPV
jgi:hypothetical protein